MMLKMTQKMETLARNLAATKGIDFDALLVSIQSRMAEQKGFVNVDGLTTLFVAIFLGSILLPIAFSNWFGADQEGWDAGTIALWLVVPTIAVVGLVIRLVKSGGRK